MSQKPRRVLYISWEGDAQNYMESLFLPLLAAAQDEHVVFEVCLFSWATEAVRRGIEQTAQSLDLVMSFGERLSATVVARLLRAHDVDAFFLDARTWTVTNHDFGQAKVDWPATQAKINELRQTWPAG